VLLKMVPETIAATWPNISEHIERALPADELTETTMNNLLNMLLLEHASCWVSYDSENEREINFVIVLMPVNNRITGEKNLLIYSMSSAGNVDLKTSNRMWLEGFQAMQKYMKANGYRKLVSYFNERNNRSLKMAERYGAEIKYYIEIDMAKEG